jgi:hypothetical protein
MNVLVPRPPPMPPSIESGEARPKLLPPGSAPVVPGVVVQSVVIPTPGGQNGAQTSCDPAEAEGLESRWVIGCKQTIEGLPASSLTSIVVNGNSSISRRCGTSP